MKEALVGTVLLGEMIGTGNSAWKEDLPKAPEPLTPFLIGVASLLDIRFGERRKDASAEVLSHPLAGP
jgi:hypothetical protein